MKIEIRGSLELLFAVCVGGTLRTVGLLRIARTGV
jgi:hypothetical protein